MKVVQSLVTVPEVRDSATKSRREPPRKVMTEVLGDEGIDS